MISLFSAHVSSLKAKFFSSSQGLTLYLCFFMELLKGVPYKAFLPFVVTYALPKWFPFPSLSSVTKLERLYRVASRAITGSLSFSPIRLLLSKASLPPQRGTLNLFTLSYYERTFRFQPPFPIQIWPDAE